MSDRAAILEPGRCWEDADGLHVDVRGLPCPEPMVTLLRLIDGGTVDGSLLAHIGQEPLLLYSELDVRGWRYRLFAETEIDGFVLEIVRAAP